MKGLSDTLARLSSLRALSTVVPGMPGADRLSDFRIENNPGALRARCYVPVNLPSRAPLVVVLHGCTQTAAGYDTGTGWSRLADANGFAVLYPEQQRGNNANLCFNWFLPGDTARDSGEAASINVMIETMISAHSLDLSRVFITGLSAGGAMSSAMLAAYPEMFASGAIIAGLPAGVASSMPEAFNAMRGDLRARKHVARPANVRLPTISVWHGSADRTVSSSNGDAIVDHWRAVHGLDAQPTRVEDVDGHHRSVWSDASGREVIEFFGIAGMAHGLPVDPSGSGSGETAGPFMLDVGISSTRHIAHFWGIAPAVDAVIAPAMETIRVGPAPAERSPRYASGWSLPDPPFADRHAKGGVGEVIENALRAAGLMK